MLKNIVKVRDTVGNTQHWEEANRNGKYQTTTMYRELHGEKEPVDWRMIFYSNPARPQAKFTLWLIYMERLATKDRLLKFGIPTDGKYR